MVKLTSKLKEIRIVKNNSIYELLDEAEYDMKNYTDPDLHNSSYHAKAEFNNCFIVHSEYCITQNMPTCPSAVSGYERMFILHIAVVIRQVVFLCILADFSGHNA